MTPAPRTLLAGLLDRVAAEAALFRQEPASRAAYRGRLLRPYRLRQFASFGAGSIVDRPIWLYGTGKIAIGDYVMILSGAWLAAARETWESPGPVISIGDRCAFRPWITLSASARIEIGSDVVLGAGCSVVDNAHTWRDGKPNVLQNPLIGDPISIGDGTWLGDKVTVVGGARIGRRCAIGANSVVLGEIPDGSVAVGAPARVVGRTADL